MSGTCKILDKVNMCLGEWNLESNIQNNKALTITNMQMTITKVRFLTRHTYKVRRYMMICICIRKPSNMSGYRGIIKCEIDISLERMSSQLRTLLGSMPNS